MKALRNLVVFFVVMLGCAFWFLIQSGGDDDAPSAGNNVQPVSTPTLPEQIERVVFGEVYNAYINDFQVYAEWDHRSSYGYDRLEDEMGEVICFLRDNVNSELPYRLMIRIDVQDAGANVSSIKGMFGVFEPDVYNGVNCEDGRYTLFDLSSLASEWDVHDLID